MFPAKNDNDGDRASKLTIFILVALAVLVQILCVACSDYENLSGDALTYDYAASSLAREGSLLQESDPVMFKSTEYFGPGVPGREPLHIFPVGFPAFLGCVYAAVGSGLSGRLASMLILAILGGVLLPPLALDLFRQLGGRGKRAEAFLLASVSLWPEGFFMARFLLSEKLTIILLTSWVWLVCSLISGRVRGNPLHFLHSAWWEACCS